MEKGIFRQKSIDRLSTPEDLKDYLHVTSPSFVIVAIAIALLLLALILWSSFAAVESYAPGNAVAKSRMLIVTFEEDPDIPLETGMVVRLGDTEYPVSSVGRTPDGRLLAVAEAGVPDGVYEVKVGYRETRVIRMLFN